MAEALEGLWVSHENGRPHLDFRPDGTVAGSDGCNGIHTSYEVSEGVATLAPFLSTLKACGGVDTWLRKVHTVRTDEASLAVFDSEGTRIGSLVREDA